MAEIKPRTCKHCGAQVRDVNFALGKKLMHIDPNAGFPSQHKGTMWEYCKLSVAEVE